MSTKNLLQAISLTLAFVTAFAPFSVSAADIIVRPIQFPVDGPATFSNDFGAPRSGGRTHEGVDILTAKMTPLVAAVDGRIGWLTDTEPSYGWLLQIEDNQGWTYHYLHINNDTPGTDDGMGGRAYAFAPGIYRGVHVAKGQLVAWAGDSGNAEHTVSHLHFEMHGPNDTIINPYYSLLAAFKPGRFVIANEKASSPTINADKALVPDPARLTYCVSGSLIRSVTNAAVYYCGADGRRFVFVNQKVYNSWYRDFSGVQMITDIEMSQIKLGGNVTYRPGTKLVKIQTDPKVYAVAHGGVLRYVTTPAIAAKLYGSGWAKLVEDIPDTSFIDYTVGADITTAD